MMHFLKLNPEPFESIKAKEKTVEMRLYDDKRRLIAPGDKITFTNINTQEQLICSVLKVNVFKNFSQLYSAYDKKAIGYKEWEDAKPEDMMQYYPLAKMQSNGVCAIEIKVD